MYPSSICPVFGHQNTVNVLLKQTLAALYFWCHTQRSPRVLMALLYNLNWAPLHFLYAGS